MKLGYRPDEAAEIIGSKELFAQCVAAGWVKPKIQRNRLTLYDYSEIAAAWERICQGEIPPPLERNTQKKNSDQKEVAHV